MRAIENAFERFDSYDQTKFSFSPLTKNQTAKVVSDEYGIDSQERRLGTYPPILHHGQRTNGSIVLDQGVTDSS